MKSLRIFFIFLSFALILSSCEKEDADALAKNKALKEKVALEMKKAASKDGKKKTVKKKTTKKAVKKTVGKRKEKKKADPILANRPDQKPTDKKDDTGSDDKKDNDKKEKQPVVAKKTVKPVVKVSAQRKKQIALRPAVIQIVTNFDNADATINGLPYPEYVPQGEEPGMVVPAGGPYNVEVKMGEKVKYYDIFLKPNETRVLFVSSTGGGAPKKAKYKKEKKKEAKKKKKEKKDAAPGKVTVYGKPTGIIMVDGVEQSEKTPGTIEMKNGRHEIQVKYDATGEISEKKIVRVRSGSKIKLFFRERKK